MIVVPDKLIPVPAVYFVSVAEMVSLSLSASTPIWTFAPALSVNVSVLESASTLVSPTAILLNAFWFASAAFHFVLSAAVICAVVSFL